MLIIIYQNVGSIKTKQEKKKLNFLYFLKFQKTLIFLSFMLQT